MVETADVTQQCNIRLSLQIVKLQPKAKLQTSAIVQYNCQAQLWLNSTQLQLKLRLRLSIFSNKSSHPATHPPDQNSRERRLKCQFQFQFQLKQRLRLGLLSNKYFYLPTDPPRQSPGLPSIPEVKGDLRGSFYGHQEQQKIQIQTWK